MRINRVKSWSLGILTLATCVKRATSVPSFNFSVCDALTREVVDKALALSEMRDKSQYFLSLHESLGSHSFIQSRILTLGYRSPLKLKAVTFGDSIVREITQSLGTCMPDSNVQYMMKPGELKPNNIMSRVNEVVPETDASLVVVGGMGIHLLLRSVEYSHIYHEHFHQVSAFLKEAIDVARRYSKTLIFVASMPMDSTVIHLQPEKSDWAAFYDTGVIKEWAPQEARIFHHMVDSERDCAFLVEPKTLVDRCPGVRCDGMHFGSEFKQYPCYNNFGLYELILSDILENEAFKRCVARSR